MPITLLDPSNKADVEGVARLHEGHLDDSPIALLGPGFLRDFFYGTLISDRLIGCLLYRVEGKVVAFLSYTNDPTGFITQGVRRHPMRLSWTMMKSVLRKPSTIRSVMVALRIMLERRGEGGSHKAGTSEAISMVVLPEYQKHVPPGGRSRLTVRLFEELAGCLREDGAERVTFLVKPENRASNIFFATIGCDFEKVRQADETVHRYTYHLSGRPASEAATA